MKYWEMNYNCIPVGKPVWAVAYDVNNETGHVNLKCLPVQGEIMPYGSLFRPFKKGTTTPKAKSSGVHWSSRVYADTKKEAEEMYNELVQRRIDLLQNAIDNARNDFLH